MTNLHRTRPLVAPTGPTLFGLAESLARGVNLNVDLTSREHTDLRTNRPEERGTDATDHHPQENPLRASPADSLLLAGAASVGGA
jgi:hypothetical protein